MAKPRGISSESREPFRNCWLSLTRGMVQNAVVLKLGRPHYRSTVRRTWYYRVKKGKEEQVWKVVFSGRGQVVRMEPPKTAAREFNPNRCKLLPSRCKGRARDESLFRRRWQSIRAGMFGGQVLVRLGDPHFAERDGGKRRFYYNVRGAHKEDLWEVSFYDDEVVAAYPAVRQFLAATCGRKPRRRSPDRGDKSAPASPAGDSTWIVPVRSAGSGERECATDQMRPEDSDARVAGDCGGELFIDLVAAHLMRDIESLTNLGIKWDKGTLAVKTGGAALAGCEAFTGDWLSALVIGGISLLSGAIAGGYKRVRLAEVRQRWMQLLAGMNAEQLAYLGTGLSQKYPFLLNSLQQLLAAGQ